MIKALVATIVVLAMTGCSSMQQSASRPDPVDREYMAKVQQQADRYGTQVYWINLPQKRATATQ